MPKANQRKRIVLKLQAITERLEGMDLKDEVFPDIEKALKGLEKLVDAATKASELKPKARAKPEQVAQNVAAGEWKLNAEEMAKVNEITRH